MNIQTALLASALAITSAGGIPSGLVWGTTLVWLTIALLLAALVGVLASRDTRVSGERLVTPRNAGRLPQLCAACAR